MTEREQIRADIKRRLNSYRDLRAEHQQITEELRRLEALLGAPSGSNLDGMPRASGVSSSVERKALKHIALRERYQAQLEKLVEAQEMIENIIEGLDSTERRLARFRYIDGLTWESVCDRLCYSWMQTHRIHGRMLDKLTDAELERIHAQRDCRKCRYFVGCECFDGAPCDLYTEDRT